MAFSTLLNTNPNSWRGEFVKQFSELRDNWDFTQVLPHSPPLQVGWNQCRERGKVEFVCGRCGNRWSSLNGVAVFRYIKHGWRGEVRMQLMGQKCQRCIDVSEFQSPKWDAQEISFAISGLLEKVKVKYYGLKRGDKKPVDRYIEGKMQGPHLSHLCEACKRGVCTKTKMSTCNVHVNNFEHGYPSSSSLPIVDTSWKRTPSVSRSCSLVSRVPNDESLNGDHNVNTDRFYLAIFMAVIVTWLVLIWLIKY